MGGQARTMKNYKNKPPTPSRNLPQRHSHGLGSSLTTTPKSSLDFDHLPTPSSFPNHLQPREAPESVQKKIMKLSSASPGCTLACKPVWLLEIGPETQRPANCVPALALATPRSMSDVSYMLISIGGRSVGMRA
ncbi:hypothetical protein D9613_011566 [Agrocybe pediades]|uniref:Uncharacterized protein n=1 Tax=Agrocybe pediades TaxID=84607 RepID=A0A8H4VQG7_9AGAR|nr:hypothetical protein D9613_011566 [Agrocybe pediades]